MSRQARRAAMFRTPAHSRRSRFGAGKAKNAEHREGVLHFFGAPAENRTPDTLIKSQVLYQLSYRGILSFAPQQDCGEFATRGNGYKIVPLWLWVGFNVRVTQDTAARYANSGHLD